MSQCVAELAGPRPVRRNRIGESASSGHRRAGAAVALLVAIGMLATVGGDALGVRRGVDPAPAPAPATGTGSGSGTTAVDPGIDRRPDVRSSVVVQATDAGLADALAT